jgi:membrane-bound ClpP family serine protease
MTDWILIFSFLLASLALVVIEVLFVPGTTLVGLFGFALAVTGIFYAYETMGQIVGHYVLAGTSLAFASSIYFSFRSEMWMRFANKTTHQAKVNEGLLDKLQEGMEGKTTSELRPIGNVEFDEKIYEVTSNSSFVEAGKMVRIVKLKDFRIFVEPLITSL